jgi:hypothetical protein
VILDLGPEDEIDDANLELVEIPQPRGMAQLVDTSQELISGKYLTHKNDFVSVIVTDEKYSTSLQAQIRDYFPFLLSFAHRPKYSSKDQDIEKLGLTRGISDLDVVTAFFAKATGNEPTEEELQIIQSVVEAVINEARSN